MTSRLHQVRVRGLPAWMPFQPLLGPGEWREEGEDVVSSLCTEDAATLATILRALWLDRRAIQVEIHPALSRASVREARLQDARYRRDTTPGFLRKGSRLDEEGRYSLTPESIAMAMARTVSGLKVVDLGAGAGGNSIAFARAGCQVTAVEVDTGRLALARHNAGLYGVADRIRFLQAEGIAALPALSGDLLFVDPPWGRDYSREYVGLSQMPLFQAALAERSRFGALWAKLPASFDTRELPGAEVRVLFGRAAGDARRIKFLWLRWE